MKRVAQIQAKRQKRFYEKRMAGRKALEKKRDRMEIKKSINLVAPALAHKEATQENVKAAISVAERAKQIAARDRTRRRPVSDAAAASAGAGAGAGAGASGDVDMS